MPLLGGVLLGVAELLNFGERGNIRCDAIVNEKWRDANGEE